MDTNETTSSSTARPRPTWTKPALIGGGVFLVFWFVMHALFIPLGGNRLQNDMNTTYETGVNYLSTCIIRVKQSAGAAVAQAENADLILSHAVQGRYQKPDGSEIPAPQGSVVYVQAIREAYPNIDKNNDAFLRVQDTINGCYNDWRDQQTAMQSNVKAFLNWRDANPITAIFMVSGAFPNDKLFARGGPGEAEDATGEKALQRMRKVVAVKEANDAYVSGTYTPEDPFAKKDTTTAPATTRR